MQKRTLGLITAPGYAEEIIDDLIDDLPRHLKHYVNNDVTWEIECHVDSWTGGTNRADRAIEWTKAEMSNNGWDYAITLTDLPLFDGKKPITAEVHSDEHVAFISLPGFGFAPMKKRVRESILQMMDEIYYGSSERERKESEQSQERNEKSNDDIQYQSSKSLIGQRFFEKLSPLKRETSNSKRNTHARFTVQSEKTGLLRIISGMINANRPMKLFKAFLKIVIIAFTTGAYALVFPTIWGLSTHFSTIRAIILMLVAILSLVAWIIISNNLWESKVKNEHAFLRKLYNATTFFTLLLTVVMYYALLFIMFMVITSLLIPPSQAAENMTVSSVTIGSYMYTAWIATSLSTIIGAIGSAFNNEDVLLNSTYGYRQQQRQQTTEEIEEEAEND